MMRDGSVDDPTMGHTNVTPEAFVPAPVWVCREPVECSWLARPWVVTCRYCNTWHTPHAMAMHGRKVYYNITHCKTFDGAMKAAWRHIKNKHKAKSKPDTP